MSFVYAWCLRICGMVLLFLAVFLYEDEEGKIQYRLEVWDKALAARAEASHSVVAGFMSGIAQSTGTLFDRLFGEKLLSLRFIATSICYSIASILLLGSISGPILHAVAKKTNLHEAPLSSLAFFVLFLLMGSLPALLDQQEKEILTVWKIVVVAIIAVPLLQGAQITLTKFGSAQALRFL